MPCSAATDVGLWCFSRPGAFQAFSISITLAGRSGILRIGFPVASNTADAMAEAASAFAASEPWPYWPTSGRCNMTILMSGTSAMVAIGYEDQLAVVMAL